MFKPSLLILAALCGAPLSAATISIYAAADSRLDQASPNGTWIPDSMGTLDIVNYMPGQERSGIFQFSLAALPTGATITGATLRLFDTGWNNADTTWLFWHADSSWNSSSVTWNTFSTDSNVLVGSLAGSAGWQYNGWTIDLSGWDWTADVIQGAATFQLREEYGNFSANGNSFYSVSSPTPGVHPYLEIEYSGGSETPEPGTFALLGAGLAAAAFRVLRPKRGTRQA